MKKSKSDVESKDLSLFDPFKANVLFLHPLHTSECQRFYVFREYFLQEPENQNPSVEFFVVNLFPLLDSVKPEYC